MHDPRGGTRLGHLVWWSLRLAWTKNKMRRREIRQNIWAVLASRWCRLAPDTVPGAEQGPIRAVWLGALLASRSMVRYSPAPRPPRPAFRIMLRLVGRTNGRAIVTAYLAWHWIRVAALSPRAPDQCLPTRS
ncbi:MAG: hypothetical protein M0Z53_03545 [Thermaerobacter sp.]|nr:hypothetical protein [Thermaerobacter sp.]